MKHIGIVLFLFGIAIISKAQDLVIPVNHVQKVDTAWVKLTTTNPIIRKDKILNEQIVDLVQAYEADSTFRKRKQHHKHIFAVISMFGYHWKAITKKRVKYVGTSVRSYGAPGEAHFTEYDIKYNMAPHLQPYIDMACNGYQVAKKMNRHGMKDQDKTVAPYCEVTPETLDKYYLHNELTPPKEYWNELDSLFFPCVAGTKHVDHVNFGEDSISLGMYGVLVSDCNHGCRPEIHPYEWIWWLEVNPKHDDLAEEKRWLVGLFRESSNRFKRWSKPPRRGVISIPFLFDAARKDKQIHIDHLVNSELLPKGLNDLTIPDAAKKFDQTTYQVWLDNASDQLTITANRTLPEGVTWWLSDVTSDGEFTVGYINIAASVRSVYTARITVK